MFQEIWNVCDVCMVRWVAVGVPRSDNESRQHERALVDDGEYLAACITAEVELSAYGRIGPAPDE